MRRREFITLLGGAASAWPLAAHAQQGGGMRRIGVLEPLAVDDPETLARVTAFAQGLQQLGWTAGRNVRIDYRWGAGDADRIGQQAAELAALAPDAILTVGASTTAPMLRATRTVPVVFVAVVDPVGAGYVDSLARPGGNATGLQHGRQMVGVAQGDCAGRHARSGRCRPIQRRPDRGPVAWHRGTTGECARPQRRRGSRKRPDPPKGCYCRRAGTCHDARG